MVATWYLISPTYFPQAKNSSIMATTRRRKGIKPQSMGKALHANNKYSCCWEEQDPLIQTPQRCYRHYIENCHQAPPTAMMKRQICIYTYLRTLGEVQENFSPLYSNILISSSFFFPSLSDLIIEGLVVGTIPVFFMSSILYLFLQYLG